MENKNPWWSEEYGFFGDFYMAGDHSLEGYLIQKKQSLHERTQAEVDGIVRLLKLTNGSSILDCPCGYGRHSIELARRGYPVTGSDLNGTHLSRAREYATKAHADVRFVQEDMRALRYDSEFSAAINMFYSFGFFDTDEENEQVLRNFYRALKEGGAFLMHTDVNIPRVIAGTYKSDEERRLASGGSLRIIDRYDPATKRINGAWIIAQPNRTTVRRDYSVRVYERDEFVALCKNVGFRSCNVYGDWNGSPYTKDSEDIIFVATK